MTKDEYAAKLAKQKDLALALIGVIDEYTSDLTEIEIVGVMQLLNWQRGMAMFGKQMAEDLNRLED